MILEAIFRGNLSAVDLVCPTDPEYKQLNHEAMELTEKLTESMSPADKALLNKLISTIYSAQTLKQKAILLSDSSQVWRCREKLERKLKSYRTKYTHSLATCVYQLLPEGKNILSVSFKKFFNGTLSIYLPNAGKRIAYGMKKLQKA